MIKIDMWYSDKKEQATSLDIYYNNYPDAFRLFVVRFACFGGRAPCCRFAFCKSPAACLRYKKNKRMFLPCRICSGLVCM